jgi:hypothetical protein
MTPQEREVKQLQEVHHSELTDNDKEKLREDELNKTLETIENIDKQSDAILEQYQDALAKGEKQKANALMTTLTSLGNARSMAETRVSNLQTEAQKRSNAGVNAQGYITEETPTEEKPDLTQAAPAKEAREQLAQMQTEALATSEKVYTQNQVSQTAQYYASSQNINTTLVQPQQDMYRANDLFSKG